MRPSGEKVRYTYDAFARLVRKDVLPKLPEDRAGLVRRSIEAGRSLLPKARVTHYLFDGNALAADEEGGGSGRGSGDGERERDDDGDGRERVFVHAPGTVEPLLQAEQGEVFAVVADHLGMPKELVDGEGRVAWAASHSAWGRVLETWRDPESGRGGRGRRERERAVESPFRLLG